MAPRSIASGTVSFGMVSIPVKLFSATQTQNAVSFNLLHKKCGGRLKQQYICPTDDNEKVEREDMVKGYEFSKDQYVTFSPEELKELEEKSTQTIEIVEFVPLAKVDPIYFDKPYYLGPEKGGEKAYRLLATALAKTGRSALGRYAARGKQYLVMLRPVEGRLVMQQLLYPDEVRSWEEVPLEDGEVKESELKLAIQLIDQTASEEFHPEHYEDDVKKRIQALIQRKVEGQEIQITQPEAGKAQIIDLMEALKQSLANKKPAARKEPVAVAEPAQESELRKSAKRAPRRVSEPRAAKK